MLFKDQFYTIINQEEENGNHLFELKLNPNHDIFKGHFPGNPVTPGVVQMEIIKELVSIVEDKPMKLEKVGNCKFLNILNPNETPNVIVELKVNRDDVSLKLSSVIKAGESFFFKMSATYLD